MRFILFLLMVLLFFGLAPRFFKALFVLCMLALIISVPILFIAQLLEDSSLKKTMLELLPTLVVGCFLLFGVGIACGALYHLYLGWKESRHAG